MNSPTHEIHSRLSKRLVAASLLRSQQIWVLFALIMLVIAIFLNNFLGSLVGSKAIRTLQVGAALFLIAMLLASLMPTKELSGENIKVKERGSSQPMSPRYYEATSRDALKSPSPRTPYMTSSTSTAQNTIRNSSSGGNRLSGAASYGNSAMKSYSTPASSSSTPRGNRTPTSAGSAPSFASPGSVPGTPMVSSVSPAASVRVAAGGGQKRSAPDNSHLFDANFLRASKAGRTTWALDSSGGGGGEEAVAVVMATMRALVPRVPSRPLRGVLDGKPGLRLGLVGVSMPRAGVICTEVRG